MNIETGTIFKFNIPYKLGVGYCKLVDFYDKSRYYGITLKVYDFFEDIAINDITLFKDIPLLMNPIPIVKMPPLRGKLAWKKIGVFNEDCDTIVPVYKEYVNEGFGWDTLAEYQLKEWNVLLDLKERIGPTSFNSVRHLEELFWRSSFTITQRVAMLLLRYSKIDVNEFFEKNAEYDNWRVDYNTQKFIPLYRNIPDAIKGRPLIKGFVPDEYLNFDWNSIAD